MNVLASAPVKARNYRFVPDSIAILILFFTPIQRLIGKKRYPFIDCGRRSFLFSGF